MAVKRLRPKKTFFLNIQKSRTFTTMLLATIMLLIIYPNTLFSYHSTYSKPHSKSHETNNAKTEEIPSTNSTVHDQLVSEKFGFFADTELVDDPFIPPENKSREDRIMWFRHKLPDLDILSPKNLSRTRSFSGRVSQFLGRNCTTRFYMTWLTSIKSFGKRQFLTMDSLFKANPESCLVIVSSSLDTVAGHRILKPLVDRGFQILTVAPDLPFLVENTPAESWLEEMKSGKKDPGTIPLSQNLSNLIRLLMLYKYGGVYLDTDVLVLRDFSGLRNCVGAQSVNPVSREWTRLNGAVMVFDVDHPLLHEFLEEFAVTFDGSKWGHNGPYLISRVIERMLLNYKYRSSPESLHGDYNFSILPTRAFYPVNWLRINRLMTKPANESEARWDARMLKELNGKETYALHLWYKWSKDYKIEAGSVVARLISDHCLVCYNISS